MTKTSEAREALVAASLAGIYAELMSIRKLMESRIERDAEDANNWGSVVQSLGLISIELQRRN